MGLSLLDKLRKEHPSLGEEALQALLGNAQRINKMKSVKNLAEMVDTLTDYGVDTSSIQVATESAPQGATGSAPQEN